MVPELERNYRNVFGAWLEFHDVIRKSYAKALDDATADEPVRYPLIRHARRGASLAGLS